MDLSFREFGAMAIKGLHYPFGPWRSSREWSIGTIAFLPTGTVHLEADPWSEKNNSLGN